MREDIGFILISIILFWFFERYSYWKTKRELAIVKSENERIAIYLELQQLCLDSTFKAGDLEHDTLLYLAERYPSLPFWHVIRILFDKDYRLQIEKDSNQLKRKIRNLSDSAKKILARLQLADIKLVATKSPVAFLLLFFYLCAVSFSLVLKGKNMKSNTADQAADLIFQKNQGITVPRAA